MCSSKVHEGIPDLITENPPHKGLQLPVGTCVLGICVLLLLGLLIQAWWTVSVAFSAAILTSLKFGQQCAYPRGRIPLFPMTPLGDGTANEIQGQICQDAHRPEHPIRERPFGTLPIFLSAYIPSHESVMPGTAAANM